MMTLSIQDLLTVLHKVSLKFEEDGFAVADVSVCFKTTLTRIWALEKRWDTLY